MSSQPSTPPPRVALGTGLAALPADADRVVLTLDVHDAEPERLTLCVRDLKQLSASPAQIERFTGSVYFAFRGLERDPRQVHTIPECREVLRGLHGRWPYWMHFLAPEPDLWTVLLLCLLPLGPGVRLPSGRIGHELDRKALKNLVLDLTSAMHELHDQHRVALAARQRIFKNAMQAIERATGARI
ncbi:MAG: hypothetical protein KF871_03175 [Hydrogenophaga sp.]|uniref:hypothetical protein n=1 Tax=Hydrogenophaga sp. TaxID=1904254 RepID=UPI001D23F24F|nr:hypothetical protein [Hydrogenophaga sp.]MBX3608873.1 hypothetical protein [Hydrogenophaga sp.]